MNTANKVMIALMVPFLTACIGGGGGGPRTPDEFRIVTKAPLVVPPEYSLRPPQTGQAQPIEADPTVVGTTAFGQSIGQNASLIERTLVANASATAISPVIRAQIDYEEARTIRKAPEASQRVLDAERGIDPVDDSATGGARVIIERTPGDSRKLPGT